MAVTINGDSGIDKVSEGALKVAHMPAGTVCASFKETDATSRSFGTSWAVGSVWGNFVKPAGTSVLFMSNVPMRNDSTGWGGGYLRLEYSLDNGATYTSLGDTGYDTVMNNGVSSISQWNMSQIIDKEDIIASTQVKFRFQHRSYDGTLLIYGSNGISAGTGYSIGASQISLLAIKV